MDLILSQWDAIEDKSSLLIYGTGAVVAVWLSSIIVNAISSVPLVGYLSLFPHLESSLS